MPKYWIHVLEHDIWTTYKRYLDNNDITYLGSFLSYPLEAKDNIIIYKKSNGKYKAGFVGVINISRDITENTKKINVFESDVLVPYVSMIKYCNYGELVSLSLLEAEFTLRNWGSIKAFQTKYTKSNSNINYFQLPYQLGEYLYEYIDRMQDDYALLKENKKKLLSQEKLSLDSDKSDKDNDDDNEDDENIEISKNKKRSSESSRYSKKSYKSDKTKSSKKTEEEYSQEYSEENESNNEETEETEEDKKEESEVIDSETKEDIEQNKLGHIPIMVIPCEKFELPTIKYDTKKYKIWDNPDLTAKIEYFINHIKKCKKCEINNNNSHEIIDYINLDSVDISYEVMTDDNIELVESIEKYDKCMNYNPFGDELEEEYIKIVKVNDAASIYHECFIIISANLKNNQEE